MKSVLLLLTALIALSSCEDYPEPKHLSGGEIDEVIIILDNERVHSALSGLLTEIFSEPYVVVNEAETRFNARIKSYSQFVNAKDLLRKYRTLVFCVSADHRSDLTALVEETIGSENVARSLRDTAFLLATARDVYARPQLVAYAYAPTEDELMKRLTAQRQRLLDRITSSENLRLQEMLFATGRDTALSRTIAQKYGIRFEVPPYYFTVMDTAGLMWLQREEVIKDASGRIVLEKKQNVVFYPFSFSASELAGITDSEISWPVAYHYPYVLRDSLGTIIRSGDMSVPLMIDKKNAPLVQREFTHNGLRVIESRGLWRTRGIGGPFINWLVYKNEHDAVMIDCFLYAPGSEKRPLMREFEALLGMVEVADGPAR